MLITDDIYEELSKRIEGGEFLGYTRSASLPELPDGTDEKMKKFKEDCLRSVALYQAKVKAMTGQVLSMRRIIEEKEATDRANLFVKDFDEKLNEQLTVAEENIARLKADLQQMKDQTANVIDQNRELKKENTKLVNKANKLHFENKKQEEKIRELQESLSCKAIDASVLAEVDNKKMDELLAKKDAEIEKIRKALNKKEERMVEMAKFSIEYCIAELIDIDKEQYEQKEKASTTAQAILVRLVKHGFGKFIDKGEIANLIMALTDIEEKRETAKKQRNIKAQQEAKDKEERLQKMEEERTKALQDASTAAQKPRNITVHGPYNEAVEKQTIQPVSSDKCLTEGGEV